MVGPIRLELMTSRLSSVRSNQLSYGPIGRSDRITPSICFKDPLQGSRSPRQPNGHQGVERETKTAAIRSFVCVKRTNRSLNSLVRDWRSILRKEVIQPQVPLRLPCYDFTPVADPTVVACLLAVSAAPSGKANSHGVTGGVYKARERIHRGMLIRDY